MAVVRRGSQNKPKKSKKPKSKSKSKRARHDPGKNNNDWRVGHSVDVLFEGQWFHGNISDVKHEEISCPKKYLFYPNQQVLFEGTWYDVCTETVPAGVKCYFDDGSKHVVPGVCMSE